MATMEDYEAEYDDNDYMYLEDTFIEAVSQTPTSTEGNLSLHFPGLSCRARRSLTNSIRR